MTLVIAHRGHSAGYPENSLAAFDAAVAAGADAIETDLRLTRDGAVVCSHDPDLSRIAGDARPIAELTAAEVAALRRPDGSPAALPFTDVLAHIAGRCRLLLDIKVGTDAMLDAVLPALAAHGIEEKVLYGARDLEHLRALRARAPGLAVLALTPVDAIAAAADAGAAIIRLWERDLADHAAAVQATGAGLCIMTGGKGTPRDTGDLSAAHLAALVDSYAPAAVMMNDPGLPLGR